MAQHDDVPARRAALLLHSLPSAARERVLGRLERPAATRLQPLLDELLQLGVSPALSRRLQHELLPSGPAAGSSHGTARERAAALWPQDVLQALKPCAPPTIARLLQAQAWPWKEFVLDNMSEPRRTEVRRLIGGAAVTPLPPAVLDALCERLCSEAARCAGERTVIATPVRMSASDRLRNALKRLGKWMR